MQDSLKFVQKEIDKLRIEANDARGRAERESQKANMYDTDGRIGDSQLHQQQSQVYKQQADNFEAQATALEPKKAELEKKANDLKAEREKINRETLDRTMAIDKELASILGGL